VEIAIVKNKGAERREREISFVKWEGGVGEKER
jgi:hypothetical protein